MILVWLGGFAGAVLFFWYRHEVELPGWAVAVSALYAGVLALYTAGKTMGTVSNTVLGRAGTRHRPRARQRARPR